MKKENICLLVVTVFVMLAFLAACSNTYENGYGSEHDDYNTYTAGTPMTVHVTPIVFEETDHIVRSLRGFASTTQVDGRQYFFEDDNDYHNTLLVYKTESLIQELLTIAPFRHSSLRINFAPDVSRYRLAGSEVTTSLDNNNVDTIGWIAHAMSVYRIPLWLSVGVEAVVREDLGLFEPQGNISNNFGDFDFVPAAWGSTDHRDALNTAYYFVRFLQENNYLDTLLELYGDNEHLIADKRAVEWFYDFSGGVMDTLFEVRLGDSSHPNGYLVRVSSDVLPSGIGHIHFMFYEFSENMTREVIKEHVSFIKDAFHFAENFYDGFGIPRHNAIDIRFNMTYTTTGGPSGWVLGSLVEIRNVGTRPRSQAIAHEMAHVFTPVFGLPTHPIFDEGLANLVGFLQYADYLNRKGLSFARPEGSIWQIAYRYGLIEAVKHKNIISTAEMNRIWEDNNIGLFMDIIVYWLQNFGDDPAVTNWIRTDRFRHITSTWPSPYLNTYTSAYSFVRYLIGTHGKERYSLLEGFENFEYVYGKSLDDMVAEWKVYLSDTMAAFR